MATHDIHVIGASAGGMEALMRLLGGLPADLPASIMIVQHLSSDYPSRLAAILSQASALPVESPPDRAPIETSRVYVAPQDMHLLVELDHVRVVRGPKENRHRPAIDTLFRSAAWSYGPRVVGVVLTGTLDDGSAGLWAIKSKKGVTVVQDPQDAMYPDMPANAIRRVQVDHCLPLDRIPSLLTKLANEPVKHPDVRHDTDSLRLETEYTMMDRDIKDMGALGKPSAFTCPECHGALWELKEGDVLRYRCHVGHAFSADSLIAEQTEQVEAALYSAMRALDEKAAILRRMAERFVGKDHKVDLEARAHELETSSRVLRQVLSGSKA